MSEAPDTGRRSFVGRLVALFVLGRFRPGRAAEAEPRSALSASQRATLEASAEILVPGAAAAGVGEFVTTMLARQDPLLCYRFVSLPMPVARFYQAALSEIDRRCRQRHGAPFSELPAQKQSELISGLARGALEDWRGPPQSLVYFLLRNDAVDAVYGQVASYQRLQIPYMAHITPPRGWPPV
jgi:hypothetical protein